MPWSAPKVLMTIASAAAEIVFDHVTKRYAESTRPAVDDLSITILAGEICVLIGPSGGGKSTAMRGSGVPGSPAEVCDAAFVAIDGDGRGQARAVSSAAAACSSSAPMSSRRGRGIR